MFGAFGALAKGSLTFVFKQAGGIKDTRFSQNLAWPSKHSYAARTICSNRDRRANLCGAPMGNY
jgi:hypothetical protein